MKVKEVYRDKVTGEVIYEFDCPGCKRVHHFNNTWSFNNDFNKPTVNPSIKVSSPNKVLCHSYVKDGFIQFLTDCAHTMAGKTVSLLEIE